MITARPGRHCLVERLSQALIHEFPVPYDSVDGDAYNFSAGDLNAL